MHALTWRSILGRAHEASSSVSTAAGEKPNGDPVHVRVRGLRKAYGEHVVLEDVSFDIYRGAMNVILGISGCGSSSSLSSPKSSPLRRDAFSAISTRFALPSSRWASIWIYTHCGSEPPSASSGCSASTHATRTMSSTPGRSST